MVVFVHSLGSLWQTKTLPCGSTRIWNTTGIRDGRQVRSCATVFGQVVFGRQARQLLAATGAANGTVWTSDGIAEAGESRKLKLIGRAPRTSAPDLYVATVTEALVGELELGAWDASRATVISFSARRSRQELMLLVRPFAWLRGANGSAVFVPDGGSCRWNVTRW